jgi:replication factor C subunit 1
MPSALLFDRRPSCTVGCKHTAVGTAYRFRSTLGSSGCSYQTNSFYRWLGQNSKQSKLQRQLGDLQIRMRLKVSGDKAEIRQSYIPSLFPHVVRPLMDTGAVR